MIRGGKGSDSQAMGRVYCEAWKTGYDGIVSREFLDRITPEMAAPPEERISPDSCLVYEENGEVTGLVNFGPSRDADSRGMGEIRTLYVLPGAWRHGVGRALFTGAAERLKAAGYKRLILWTLSQNARARGFYEHMGMTSAGERNIVIAGEKLRETRYEMDI